MLRPFKEKSVFDAFVETYVSAFVECMAEGCDGGLYQEEIFMLPGAEGVFGGEDLKKFVRFQHGDNDYGYRYGQREDAELQNNPEKLAAALLRCLDTERCDKAHWDAALPHLLGNIRESLRKIVEAKA